MKKKTETGRKCAICGRRRSPGGQKDTYGFKTILAEMDVKREDVGPADKAHRECVIKLGALIVGLKMHTEKETSDVD